MANQNMMKRTYAHSGAVISGSVSLSQVDRGTSHFSLNMIWKPQ